MPALTAADTIPAARSTDVLVIGAGPAGLALAAALGRAGVAVAVLERAAADTLADPAADGRDLALTRRSLDFLDRIGVRERLPAGALSPIREARVLDGRSPFALTFAASDALGQHCANHHIRRASWEAVQALPGVTLRTGAVIGGIATGPYLATVELAGGERWQAPLLVAADGRFSTTRRALGIGADMLDFGRSAIVCRMRHAGTNGGIARECFGYGGTLAVLPLAENLSSIVLTLPTSGADAMMGEPPARFASLVAARLDGELGPMMLEGERHAYPLVATWAHRFVAPRAALLGDAAVGMHPVTAHGYNFGLYGADALAGRVSSAHRQGADVGAATLLADFQRNHRRATRFIYEGTNALVKLYTDERAPARLARGAVLRAARRFPPVTRWITRQLSG